MTADTAQPTKPAPLWRHGDFMKLWSAQTTSILGSQITLLALPLTAIVLLDAGPGQVGLLATAQYLAFPLIGLAVGAWADRMRRRPVLIVADLARAAILLAVPLLYLTGHLQLWMLYPVAVGVGVFTVFFDVTHQSYLPALIDRDRLGEGNAKLEISYQAGQLAGPGIGGTIIAVLSAPVALVFDAVTYLVSALLLYRIKTKEPEPAKRDPGGPGIGADIMVGLRYVLTNKYLRPIALATAIGNLFGVLGVVQAVFALFATRDLGMSAAALGIALALANGGALLGAVLSGAVTRFLKPGIAMVAGLLAPAAAILLLPMADKPYGLILLAGAMSLAWFGIAVFNINQITLRQTITPGHLLGRMNATVRVLIWGTIPLGTALGGLLAELIGIRATLVVSGIGSLAAVIPLLLSPVWRLKELPSAPSEEASGD